MTKKEKAIIYKAAECIETKVHFGTCSALMGAKEVLDIGYSIASKYIRFYDVQKDFGCFWVYDSDPSLTNEERKAWRVLLLLWFAEVGELEGL